MTLKNENFLDRSAGSSRKGIGPYVSFLNSQSQSPVDYIMGLFNEHDIVVLCERFHPEATQYDLIYDLVSDNRFITRVGNVFTEVGTSTNNNRLREIMFSEGLGDDEAEGKILQLYRNLSWMPVWPNYNFFNFLQRLYKLNKSLAASGKIDLRFSDIPFSWEGMTRKKYQEFQKTLPQRDSVMAEQIIKTLKGIQKSGSQRKKALVIMNYRHAFNDKFLNAEGAKANNTGRFVFEAFPGKTANVMLNSVAFLPGSGDNEVFTTTVSGGKWDAAFASAGNPDLGFDFKGNIFGADHFDYWPFFKHDYSYQDVFTGLVFYKPLEAHRLVCGIPKLFENGWDKVLLERMALSGAPVAQSKRPGFIAEGETIREECYEELPALLEKIRHCGDKRGIKRKAD